MKENLTINLKNANGFISGEEVLALAQQSVRHLDSLNAGTGPGNDFLGWLSLPDDILSQLDRIEKIAKKLRDVTDTTIVIGIGGSYLGARAVIEALSHSFSPLLRTKHHDMIFAGQNICEDYMSELLELLDGKNYSIIAISKSGTTTEPAIAFRMLKDHLERKIGKPLAADRIIAITDAKKGALRSMAETHGYETFVIPDNIGGRYSVLTPVGLLPIAVSGLDIRMLVKGAKAMEELTRMNKKAAANPSLLYAAARNLLLQSGKSIEIMVGFTPKLHFMSEWWKQLYGESEGKDGKGIFPASVDMTTDLHSMGQYIQDGQRILFETVIQNDKPRRTFEIHADKDNLDGLNFLSGMDMNEVNKKAMQGTVLAHVDGKVPNMILHVPEFSPYWFGQLVFFFEKACGISGYLLAVNPFNQPGVEAYKKNMFALLGKPGYEKEKAELEKRLAGQA